MSTNTDDAVERTIFDPSLMDEDAYFGYSAFDDFNLHHLLPDTKDDSWVSRFEAQLIDSSGQQSPLTNTHSFSGTDSGTGTPALEQLEDAPDAPQLPVASIGSAAPPPKIGARFSREAVRVLRQWVSTHSDHPFPSDHEKEILQNRTGLSKTQILNWLANARRRGKIQARHPGSPHSPSSTQAIDIPGRKPTPAPGERNRWMDPLARWVDSPPESEPATATAIARAVASCGSDDLSDTHYQTGHGHWLSRASSTSSIGTSQSSDNSAYSQHSRDSMTSFRSSSRSSRRRRHNAASKRADKRTSLARSLNTYQCTFCTETFTTKHTWQRHEKSLHLPIERWACAPNGPRIMDDNGVPRCAFCSQTSPDDAHFQDHNYSTCSGRPLQDRSFNRKDHLTQHLRLVHNVKPEQLGCPLNQWKLPMPRIRSVCGFCGLKMDTWEFRADHLADHFKMGSTMADWKGDWGFDASVLFRVEHAIPAYFIGIDRNTLCPFEASKGPSETPRDAYELISLELANFVHVYSDKFGGLPTYDKMQLEACRILLSAEVISDREDSNASWLRDLIISADDILQEAKMRPVRSILEGKLRRLKIPGKDNLFDLCPMESQLYDFIHAGPPRSFNDVELQQEASRLIQQAGIESDSSSEYVASFFIHLINSSAAWLTPFRDRHNISRMQSSSDLRSGSLSRINSILHNYSELERTLADYIELLRAHGIVPDDATLRQKANDIIDEMDDEEWKSVALNNEAWLAKFKSRHMTDPNNQPNTFTSGCLHHSDDTHGSHQNINSDGANTWMKTSFLLNGDCYYRWIARELARWVAMTMSPNNPNQHVPTDEEIQHHARWILYNDGDPWNQTVADNPAWLRQFKIDVGILKPEQADFESEGNLEF
ncbi:hypothetical protein CDV36_005447 [Fusarium kuroshium]|uniref:Homeobox domain-containing protein n=1 Tax=Fusarium kuroshium TaxID=2010991 RepID=A0A3M2SBD3_9HYPO|nr:hypothetical protein CDV36_005447 [Fusarium kuroshium]